MIDLRPWRQDSPFGDTDIDTTRDNLIELESIFAAEHRLGTTNVARGEHKTRLVSSGAGSFAYSSTSAVWQLVGGVGLLPASSRPAQGDGQVEIPLLGSGLIGAAFQAGIYDVFALARAESSTSPVIASYADLTAFDLNIITVNVAGDLVNADFSMRMHASVFEARGSILGPMPSAVRGDALPIRQPQTWFRSAYTIESLLSTEHSRQTGAHRTRKIPTCAATYEFDGGSSKFASVGGSELGVMPTQSAVVSSTGVVSFTFTTPFASADDYDILATSETAEAGVAVAVAYTSKSTTGFTLIFAKVQASPVNVTPASFSLFIHQTPGSVGTSQIADRRDFNRKMRLDNASARILYNDIFDLLNLIGEEHDPATGDHATRKVSSTSATYVLAPGPVYSSVSGSVRGNMPDASNTVVTTGEAVFVFDTSYASTDDYDILATSEAINSTNVVAVSYKDKATTGFKLIFTRATQTPAADNPPSFSVCIHEAP